MNNNTLSFISFEPMNQNFKAFLSVEGFISGDRDYELQLKKAIKVYSNSLMNMNIILDEINAFRKSRKLLPARKVWQLGDTIFKLQHNLSKLFFQLDGVYDHLVRDLGVKRKWLEKVIIFRRYLPDKNYIPQSLNWGRCEKGTRRVAEKLRKGLYLE